MPVSRGPRAGRRHLVARRCAGRLVGPAPGLLLVLPFAWLRRPLAVDAGAGDPAGAHRHGRAGRLRAAGGLRPRSGDRRGRRHEPAGLERTVPRDPRLVRRRLRHGHPRSGRGVGGDRREATTPSSSHPPEAARPSPRSCTPIDRLMHEPVPADRLRRCRVLYVSPLKALAVDVERNLRSPLVGIEREAARLGLDTAAVTIGIRTGDTPPAERARLRQATAGHPHHHARVALPACSPRRPARPCVVSTPSSSTRCTRSRAPSAERTSPSPSSGSTTCSTGRPSASACRRP